MFFTRNEGPQIKLCVLLACHMIPMRGMVVCSPNQVPQVWNDLPRLRQLVWASTCAATSSPHCGLERPPRLRRFCMGEHLRHNVFTAVWNRMRNYAPACMGEHLRRHVFTAGLDRLPRLGTVRQLVWASTCATTSPMTPSPTISEVYKQPPSPTPQPWI